MYIMSNNRLGTPHHRIFSFIRSAGNNSEENHTKKGETTKNTTPNPYSFQYLFRFRDLQNNWSSGYIEQFSVTGFKRRIISFP